MAIYVKPRYDETTTRPGSGRVAQGDIVELDSDMPERLLSASEEKVVEATVRESVI